MYSVNGLWMRVPTNVNHLNSFFVSWQNHQQKLFHVLVAFWGKLLNWRNHWNANKEKKTETNIEDENSWRCRAATSKMQTKAHTFCLCFTKWLRLFRSTKPFYAFILTMFTSWCSPTMHGCTHPHMLRTAIHEMNANMPEIAGQFKFNLK